MSGEHSHQPGRRLQIVTVMIAVFMIIELAVGVAAHSVALMADAGHLLGDVVAAAAAAWVARLVHRPARGAFTFGLRRAEILSAAGNGIALLVAGALVIAAALPRLIHPRSPDGTAMVFTGLAGLLVNAAATLVLLGGDRRDLNVAGIFRHVLADLASVLITVVAGLLVIAGFPRADPAASLMVATIMIAAAWGLLRASGRVLLEAAPPHVDLAALRDHLAGSTGVLAVHDLHVWSVGSTLPAVSAHVVVSEDTFTGGRAPALLDELQSCLVGHFDVEHSTFQLEPAGHTGHEPGAHA